MSEEPKHPDHNIHGYGEYYAKEMEKYKVKRRQWLRELRKADKHVKAVDNAKEEIKERKVRHAMEIKKAKSDEKDKKKQKGIDSKY